MRRGHMVNKKRFISIFTQLMTAKPSKVMAYGIGPPCTKSHGSLIEVICSITTNKKRFYFQLKKIYGHQLTGQWLMTWDQHLTYHEFFPPQNCTFNLTQSHCKITFVSKRNGATNISTSKPLYDLKLNLWQHMVAEFCINIFVL